MSVKDSHDFINPDTGEVFVPKGDLENAEAEIRRLRRRVKAHERKEEDQRQANPNRQLILSLIERWKRATNHPKSVNSSDRFDIIQARLKDGYTPKQIEMAIDGIAAMPYVGPQGRQSHNGRGSKRHDRLGIALGSGEALERFANLGALAKRNGNP
jgi:hypothetical protein